MFQVKVKIATRRPLRVWQKSHFSSIRAQLSWIPREIIERIGVASEMEIAFQVADGRELTRPVGPVKMTIDGGSLTLPVAFCEAGEEAVLGVTVLEVHGFAVDPIEMKLVPRKHLALLRT
jgi:hypothetical protein